MLDCGVEMFALNRILILGLLFILSAVSPVFANENPINFEADQVTVDQETGSMRAIGNVVLRQSGTELIADDVTYDRTNDTAIAVGNVVMTTSDGTQRRADRMTLDTEFTHVVAENLRTRFIDGSFFVADSSDTVTGDRSIFTSSRFSPCNCDLEKGENPHWDVRATSSTHNEKTQTITHRNVRMHVLNVPFFYLPYLAHPDWTVRRRSGFLVPSTSISLDRGISPAIRYFKVIDDNSDALLTAHKYQYRGLGLHTLYRKRWDVSDLDVNLYTARVNTFKKSRENVAAINAYFRTQIGNGWNVKAKMHRASQDTFARRYKFDDSTRLKSFVTAERITPNRYYFIETSDVQGLNATDTPEREPIILPRIVYEKVRTGWRPNQRLLTEISAIQLDNDEEHDLARWSANVGVSEEFRQGPAITSYSANVLSSYYAIHQKPSSATTRTGEFGQINPSLAIGARLPLAITTGQSTSVLEPRAQLVWVGGADNTKKVPNRDSADYRIDEANLFLSHRYQGKDYVLPGSRADMGVSLTGNARSLGQLRGFIGVSRRLSGEASAGLAPEQEDRYSDYVASLAIDPPGSLSLRWYGRLSSNNLELNESSTYVSAAFGDLAVSLNHNQLAKAYFANSTSDREELILNASMPVGNSLSASVYQNWDLSNGENKRHTSNAALVWSGGVQNCLTLRLDYSRDATKDRDISRGDEFKLTFNFKYLGSIGNDAVTNLTASES